MVQGSRAAAAGRRRLPHVAPGATMVYQPKPPDDRRRSRAEELGLEREIATLDWNGKQHELDKRRVVIGRSKDCDIQVADPNVSRRHAEVRQEGAAYWVVDLDSTNGIEVNGRRQKRAKLRHGDTHHARLDRARLPAGVGG